MHVPLRILAVTTVLMCLVATRSGAAEDAPPLRYYVGHEVVVVQVKVTTTLTRKIETLTGDDRERCTTRHQGAEVELCVSATERVTREGSVDTKFVPNPALHADISLASRALTDDLLTIEMRDGMLLKSINVKSTGQAGAFIASIAKIAGVFVGMPGSFAQTGTPKSNVVATTTCNPFARPLVDLRVMTERGDL